MVKLFPASHSDKNYNLDRSPLFTVFATYEVIQMQKFECTFECTLFSSNVLLYGVMPQYEYFN